MRQTCQIASLFSFTITWLLSLMSIYCATNGVKRWTSVYRLHITFIQWAIFKLHGQIILSMKWIELNQVVKYFHFLSEKLSGFKCKRERSDVEKLNRYGRESFATNVSPVSAVKIWPVTDQVLKLLMNKGLQYDLRVTGDSWFCPRVPLKVLIQSVWGPKYLLKMEISSNY